MSKKKFYPLTTAGKTTPKIKPKPVGKANLPKHLGTARTGGRKA